MRSWMIGILLCLSCGCSLAELKTISFNVLTKHYMPPARYNMQAFNENNEGIGFDFAIDSSEHMYMLGYYKNSFYKDSFYAAKNFMLKKYRNIELTLAAGLVSGYADHPLLVVPAIKYKNLRAGIVDEAVALQGVWNF